ncbi:kinesin-like protein KIN-14P [Lotus japonicus]|uniref:kinesin-like protein KIN-14P n=1 Tax=Lotus japonicus TaxID=34305 RepID=UPI00258F500B|nr:kinesin-like protein KIN-14P [Lotus japonicus]
MNTPFNNHTAPRDLGSSGVDSSGISSTQRKVLSESKFQRVLPSPIAAEPLGASINQAGQKFNEVFQLKQGSYADLPASKITELMKSTSLDNAPTQSLLSVVNGILEESVERRNGEIPHRVACLLRKVVQEIERRISTQNEHLRTQKNLYKAREDKYQSRIRVLEALASGTREESEIEKTKIEEQKIHDTLQTKKETQKDNKEDEKEVTKMIKELEEKTMEIKTLKQELDNKADEKEVIRLIKELEDKNMQVTTLKQELETMKKAYQVQCSQLEAQVNNVKGELQQKSQEYEHQLENLRNKVKEHEASSATEELEDKKLEVTTLKQELETMKKTYEAQCSKLQAQANDAKGELKQKSQEYEHQLEKLRNKIKEHETSSLLKYQKWNMKENKIQKSVNFQFGSIQKLKLSWESIKQDVMKQQRIYAEECNRLGGNLKSLAEAAESYQSVLTENRKLFHEVQELKGNIRVFCRIRPFLPGQKEKQSIVEHMGETDLVVANPSKQGKEALRTFKFNKVFTPASTQAEVYADIQAFIRAVLDGFNVCIFAYGQTGSGKTYTMSGPNGATSESVGVNYRALNDLFSISSSRKSTIVYDIGVQIIEIYNEQVRDLLSTDASPKKLGILNHSQPNGLAVPDASMQPVKSTADVIRLMDIGHKNRAKGATAMNERSSRSHSVVSIHVRGLDKKSGSSLQGNLHLVDLAGSERVDRSEATGDRLKEAQHINKSLSALGDVIFALAQKSAHVPYRNSKLTQLLQTSLGGKAKTLMLVQINSDIKSYSESMSTLKFAERVSGVELGAAKSTKEGRDVRELMEQVASLKDTILTKDEEIERLQLLKDLKNVYPNANSD